MCLNVMAFSVGAHLQYTINNFKKLSTFRAVTKQKNQTGINIGSSAITKLQSCCANMYNCNNNCFRDDEWCNLANWPGTPTFCIWSRAPIALHSLMINVMEMKLHMFCARAQTKLRVCWTAAQNLLHSFYCDAIQIWSCVSQSNISKGVFSVYRSH